MQTLFAILPEHCLLDHGHSGGHLRVLKRSREFWEVHPFAWRVAIADYNFVLWICIAWCYSCNFLYLMQYNCRSFKFFWYLWIIPLSLTPFGPVLSDSIFLLQDLSPLRCRLSKRFFYLWRSEMLQAWLAFLEPRWEHWWWWSSQGGINKPSRSQVLSQVDTRYWL